MSTEDERLVHGNELLVDVVAGYDADSTEYRTSSHTVSAIAEALSDPDRSIRLPEGWTAPDGVTDALGLMCGYLFLDALIGNTDRHHENWAIVESLDAMGANVYVVAPTFDHGSSLGRNEPLARVQERLRTRDENFTVEAYADRARSAIYANSDDHKPLTPIAAFVALGRRVPDAARAWCERLSRITDSQVTAILDEVPDARMNADQKEFAMRMLSHNRSNLATVCEEL